MAFALILDHKLGDALNTLKPHFSAFNLNDPFTISSDLGMPKPAIATIGNYLYHQDSPVPDKVTWMQQNLTTY